MAARTYVAMTPSAWARGKTSSNLSKRKQAKLGKTGVGVPEFTPPAMPSLEQMQEMKETIMEKRRRRLETPPVIQDAGELGTANEWDQAVSAYGFQTMKGRIVLNSSGGGEVVYKGQPAPRAADTVNESKGAPEEPAEAGDAVETANPRRSRLIQFGRKYLGLAAIPTWMLDNLVTYLRPRDPRRIRYDYFRILDAARSTSGVPMESAVALKNRQWALLRPVEPKHRPDKASEVEDFMNDQDGDQFGTPAAKVMKPGPTEEPVYLRPHTLAYGDRETDAYLATRVPAHYGVITNVLGEVRRRLPDYQPTSMLDFGTGPGTGVWAAHEEWRGRIQRVLGIDISESMLQAAERLAVSHGKAGSFQPIGQLEFQRHMSYGDDLPRFDLVLSAFVLSEMPTDILRESTLESLWGQTGDVLVLIDRGTQLGYEQMMKARDWFIERSKTATGEFGLTPHHIVAPCPHEHACPLRGRTTWCHFSQRAQRPRFTMDAKAAKNNMEDLKYTYLVIRRGPKPQRHQPVGDPTAAEMSPEAPPLTEPQNRRPLASQTYVTALEGQKQPLLDITMRADAYNWSRLVLPPIKRSGHLIADACTPHGQFERQTFVKSDGRTVYKDLKQARWGDLLPYQAKHTAKREVRMQETDEDKARLKAERTKGKKGARGAGKASEKKREEEDDVDYAAEPSKATEPRRREKRRSAAKPNIHTAHVAKNKEVPDIVGDDLRD